VNVEAYISSGILEAYALGELSEQERAEVEKNLSQYPQLRTELALIEEAQEALLMKAAVKPSITVKQGLFAAIDAQKPTENVIALKPQQPALGWKLAAAASITLAVISSYLAVNYWT
jgi:anti-sigma factor RsiW